MKLQATQRLGHEAVCASCGNTHRVNASAECNAARSQGWFTKLEESAKQDYVKKFPGSKFLRHPHIKDSK